MLPTSPHCGHGEKTWIDRGKHGHADRGRSSGNTSVARAGIIFADVMQRIAAGT
jgi:hypothetical protein